MAGAPLPVRSNMPPASLDDAPQGGWSSKETIFGRGWLSERDGIDVDMVNLDPGRPVLNRNRGVVLRKANMPKIFPPSVSSAHLKVGSY